MSKEKILSRLRFPEFQRNVGWDKLSLRDVAEIVKGKQLNRLDLTESGTYPCLNGGVSPSGYTEKFNTEANTITISEGGNSCGYVSFMTTEFWLGGHCYKIVLKNSSSLEFFYQLLKVNELRIMRLRVGSGLPNIQKGTLLNLEIPFLSNQEEQKKIALCLSSLDDLIAAHYEKLDTLKVHKKGLMQNLFPQEGQKVPNYRFPEFINDGKWSEKALGSVFNTFSGGTPKSTEKKYYGGTIPFIRSGEITKTKTELFLTKDGLDSSSAKIVTKGDLLIALYGANSGEVSLSKIDGAINQAILCLRSDFSNEFVSHYFSHMKDWIVRRYIQGGQGNLSGEIVKSVELFFPKQEEQQKIASCLSALDDLIIAQTEKIEQLQQHKKGLMQGLFPKVES